MLLVKDGVTYDLTDKTQLDAFLGSGWAVAASTREERRPVDIPAFMPESSEEKPRRRRTKAQGE